MTDINNTSAIVSAITDWRASTAKLDAAQVAMGTKAEKLWTAFCAAGIDNPEFLRMPKGDEKKSNAHVAGWSTVKASMTLAMFGELVAGQIADSSIGEGATLVAANGRNKALTKAECKQRVTADIARLRKQIVAMLEAKKDRTPSTPKTPHERADVSLANAVKLVEKALGEWNETGAADGWRCDVPALAALLLNAQKVIRKAVR